MYARMRYKIVSETIHIVMAGTISKIAVNLLFINIKIFVFLLGGRFFLRILS